MQVLVDVPRVVDELESLKNVARKRWQPEFSREVFDLEQPVQLESGRLPRCAIRRTCRWFAQRGADACAVCPRVVADIGGTETYSSTLGGPDPSPA